MGLVSRIRNAWAALTGAASRAHSLLDPALRELFGVTSKSAAGVAVTEQTAMAVSTYHACVRILAEEMACLPLQMFSVSDEAMVLAPFHPLQSIFQNPNPEMTWFTFCELMMVNTVRRGNGIAVKEIDQGGRLISLWPVRPDRVIPIRINGKMHYTVFVPYAGATGWDGDIAAFPWWDGYTAITIPEEFVFHIRNLGDNGISGRGTLDMMRDTLGLAIGAERYGSKLLSNSARPGGSIEIPHHMSKDAYDRLKDSWNDIHAGIENSHKVAILEEGAKFNPHAFTADEAQLLQTRTFQVPEIVRPFRIPLQMVAHQQGMSYGTAEALGLDFKTHTMTPWVSRWEQEIRRQLLPRSDQKRYSAEFDMDELMRGDMSARNVYYKAGRDGGWFSVDEIRRREGYNPLPDGAGRVYLQPMNMVAAGCPPIAALVQVTALVAAGKLPEESAVAMILAAYPSVKPQQAKALIAPAAAMVMPAKPQAIETPKCPPQMPPSPETPQPTPEAPDQSSA